jgi:hypothetical protein
VLSRAAYLVRAVLLREPIDERFDLGLRSLAIGHNTLLMAGCGMCPNIKRKDSM